MRILWLKSDLLLPLDKGGRLRTWHLLRHLARRHEIAYVSFADPGTPPEHLDGMRTVASRIDTIERSDPPKGSLRFYLDAARHVADPLPYAVGKYRSRAFRRIVEARVADWQPDLVVSDFLAPVVNLPERLPCPSVLFTHNVEAEIWRRHAETKRRPVARALFAAQHRCMLRFEAQALERFDGVLAVSDADRETFGRLYPAAVRRPIHVVPTGVDTQYFRPAAGDDASVELVFTGSMDWLPNEDAMLFFCRDVLPRIRAARPTVRLTIVGRAPTPSVRQLAHEAGVRVTGRVDDVRPYMSEAAVYVVPLRIGGGTRLKIFEAMAMAKAVVSTRVGAEGLPIVDGEHARLADDPARFADVVVTLLRDPAERARLGQRARQLVLEHFDWSAVAGELETALCRVAAPRLGEPFPCESRSLVLDT